jgi:hypothetical protein
MWNACRNSARITGFDTLVRLALALDDAFRDLPAQRWPAGEGHVGGVILLLRGAIGPFTAGPQRAQCRGSLAELDAVKPGVTRHRVTLNNAGRRLGLRLGIAGSIGLGSRIVVAREIHLAGQREDLYSLVDGETGKPVGIPCLVSKHRTRTAAGPALAHEIRTFKAPRPGIAAHFYVLDTATGAHPWRNEWRDSTFPNTRRSGVGSA